MRLDLTHEQELMRDTARRFLEAESPLSVVRKAAENRHVFDAGWWQRASELGWTMMIVPEHQGGLALSGKPVQDLCIVAEELGRQVAPGPYQTTVLALAALSTCLNYGEFSELCSQLMDGRQRVAWAFSEPGSVWACAHMQTTLVNTEGGWQLDGIKSYVESAQDADYLVVTALCKGQPMQLLVALNTPGISVTPCQSLDCVRQFAQVRFNRVQVADHSILKYENPDEVLRYQGNLAVLMQCAETNGAIERAMNFTMAYMQERYAFGRAIASYQALKHRLADMYLGVHSCMAITDAAANALDSRESDMDMLSLVAKSFVGGKSTEIMSDLVQMTGGIAVTWEHDLHLFSRRVALNRALYGTPEYHRFQLQKWMVA